MRGTRIRWNRGEETILFRSIAIDAFDDRFARWITKVEGRTQQRGNQASGLLRVIRNARY